MSYHHFSTRRDGCWLQVHSSALEASILNCFSLRALCACIVWWDPSDKLCFQEEKGSDEEDEEDDEKEKKPINSSDILSKDSSKESSR